MARLIIEVVFAAPAGTQEIVTLSLESGARAIDALRASGLPDRHPQIDMLNPALGIFGMRVTPDTALVDGDRVEVYRPLKIDPKESRRALARARRRTPHP